MTLLQSFRVRPLGIKVKEWIPALAWERRPSLLFGLTSFAMASSLLLGGGTHGGFLSDPILELLAIPAFLISLFSLFNSPSSAAKQRAEWPLLLCLAIVLVPLLQLVPLPPWIWTKLPQRDEITKIFDLLGGERPWLPISTSPSSTWVSVLSLLPPLAIFLGVIQLSYRERRSFSLIVLGVGVVSAFVGVIQVVQGPSSPLRFFAVTSDVEAVGFFANTNHFAALMYTLLIFGIAWTTDLVFTIKPWKDRKTLETSSFAALTASFLVLVVFIASDAMTRSRAGFGLMIVAVFAGIALPIRDQRRTSGMTQMKFAFGAGLAVFFLVFQFGLYRLYDRLAVDPMAEARIPFARNTIAAAKAYMPLGSGVGTFVTVYPNFEPPQDAIANIFANHAHNDFLELWLEGGAISVVLLAAFVLWLLLRTKSVWWRTPGDVRPIDTLLMRAATIAILLIMAHSLVDYPLRTGAMMAVFAFSCALLVEPLMPARDEKALDRGLMRRSKEPAPPPPVALSKPQTPPPAPRPQSAPEKPLQKPTERWGEEIEWPEQWRNDRH